MNRKLLGIAVCLFFTITQVNSQKTIKEATVYSKVVSTSSIIDAPPVISFITTWYKGPNLKITTKNLYSENSAYIDRVSQKTISLYEIAGRKIGFYATDTLSSKAKMLLNNVQVNFDFDTIASINGFSCRKAMLMYPEELDLKPVEVWYSPDFRFSDRNLGVNVFAVEKIPGAIISFRVYSREVIVDYQVLSIDCAATIAPDLFKIPKDYEIVSAAEFRNKIKPEFH
jgi:hypothetical protein